MECDCTEPEDDYADVGDEESDGDATEEYEEEPTLSGRYGKN